MKKYVLLISIVIIIGSILLIYVDNNDKLVLKNDSNKQIVNSNALTMMYETEAGSGEYQVIKNDNWVSDEYEFNTNLSKCENGSFIYYNEEENKVYIEANSQDRCYVYFDVIEKALFADYIKSLYSGTDSDGALYYHDGTGVYGELEAGDNSYRYTGTNPNNYVCFGSDLKECPVDNLYRIIGVFDNQVKLVKYDYATKETLLNNGAYFESDGSPNDSYLGILESIPWYKWGSTNTWNTSELNTINLNTNYVNSLGEWIDYIAQATWQVGGGSESNLRRSTAQETYNYEVGINNAGVTYQAKIALIYLSDYYYAASPEYWNYQGGGSASNDYRNATNNNWLYMGGLDWTISRNSGTSASSYNISWLGYVNTTAVGSNNGIRPSFYLKNNIYYQSGDGSINNPYRVRI